MTAEQTLKKALEKAVENGFERIIAWSWETHFERGEVGFRDYAGLIFQKEFAEAFWGEGVVDWEKDREMGVNELWSAYGSGADFDGKRWQYHLQQMVLEEDPISYLAKFI